MIKRTVRLFLSTCFFCLLWCSNANAEAHINPVKPTDMIVTGTAKANQKLMLFHREAWLKTRADENGAFRFNLSSSAGQRTMYLESEEDGDFVREESLLPEPDEIEPPLYLGKRDGEWIFYGSTGELSVLIDGKVYSSHELLHVPVTDAKEAKAYVENNGKRSKITILDLTRVPMVPFTLTESPADGRRITGKTLPYQSIKITYTGVNIPDYQGPINFDQSIIADEDGNFDSPLTVPLLYRNGVSYQLSLPNVGSDAVLANMNGEKRPLTVPNVDSLHPLTTVSEDHFWLTSDVNGMTYPNHNIYLKKKDGTLKLCTTSDDKGYFRCFYDSETFPVELSVFSPDGVLVVTKKVEIAPNSYNRWSINIDAITNETENLTGTALPHSTLTISYYGENPFTLKTRADEVGNFRVNVPRRAGGTYVVNGKSTYRGISHNATPESRSVYDTRPLSTPTYAFYDGMLVIYAQHKKLTTLSAELSIIRTDGSFKSQSIPMSGSSGQLSTQPLTLNKGDLFTIYLKDSSNMESTSISGEYIPLEQPVLEELTDMSTEIIGTTATNILVYYNTYIDDKNQRVTTISDENGKFRLPISRSYRPLQLFAETADKKYSTSMYLFYRDTPSPPVFDTTPPKLSFQRFNQTSTSFFWKAQDATFLTFRFHYRNGTVEEEVRHDVSPEGTWIHNKNLFDIAQVEVTATDEAGNTSKTLFLKPIDTTPPSSAKVNDAYPGETFITGTAEIDSTVQVTYGGKIYKNQTNKDGKFSVQVPVLRTGDLVSVKVLDEAGNLSNNPTKIKIIGVTKMMLSPDRKTLTMETNASYWNSLHFRLEGSVKVSNTSVREQKWSYQLKNPLPNHAVVRVHITNFEGTVFSTFEQKFSDTITPAVPTLLPVTTKSVSLTGTAEPFSTVILTFNGKTYQTPVDAKGHFSILQKGFIAGTTVSAITRDTAGNVSLRMSTKVNGILSLSTTKLTSRSTSLSSQTTPAATVILYKSGKQIQRVTAGKTGTFKLNLPKQKAGTKLILKVTKPNYTTLVRTITVSK